MTEVSTEQALEILGLDPDATAEEVERRFRALASETHPDHGGSTEGFARIMAARDRLKAGAEGGELVRLVHGNGAISVAPQSELATIERERNAAREREQNSERVTKGLVRAEVSRLTRSRRRASFLTWLGGGTAALTLALRATSSTAEYYVGFPWVAPVLIFSIVFGTVCAIGGFAVSDQISRIEQAIEDAAETMANRSVFLDLMYEIEDSTQGGVQDIWTTGELTEAVDLWGRSKAQGTALATRADASVPRIVRIALLPLRGLRRIARWSLSGRFDSNPSLADLAVIIGPEGFTRLLIAKGEEARLLVTEEEVDDGRLLILHRLVIEPIASKA